MKKTAFAVLVLVLILLAACGKQPTVEIAEPDPTEIPSIEIAEPDPTEIPSIEIPSEHSISTEDVFATDNTKPQEQSQTPSIMDEVNLDLFTPCNGICTILNGAILYAEPSTSEFPMFIADMNVTGIPVIAIGKPNTSASNWYIVDFFDTPLYAEQNSIKFKDSPTQNSPADEQVFKQPAVENKQPVVENKQPVVEQPTVTPQPQPQQPTVTPQPQPQPQQPSGSNEMTPEEIKRLSEEWSTPGLWSDEVVPGRGSNGDLGGEIRS